MLYLLTIESDIMYQFTIESKVMTCYQKYIVLSGESDNILHEPTENNCVTCSFTDFEIKETKQL